MPMDLCTKDHACVFLAGMAGEWFVGSLLGWVLNYLLEILCCSISLLVKMHSRLLGLLGGLAYALFSADTTQAYLTMSLGGQISAIPFYYWLFMHTFMAAGGYPTCLSIRSFFLLPDPFFIVFMAAPLLGKLENSKRLLEEPCHAYWYYDCHVPEQLHHALCSGGK